MYMLDKQSTSLPSGQLYYTFFLHYKSVTLETAFPAENTVSAVVLSEVEYVFRIAT